MKRRISALLLALVMCLGLAAPAFAAETEFVINEQGTLTQYNGPGGDVTVPDGVTAIGWGAFRYNKTITKVTLPKGVTRIDESAFLNCEKLTAVVLPEGLVGIGKSAFAGCTSLTDLKLPSTVESIKEYAFYNTPWFAAQNGFIVKDGVILYCEQNEGDLVIPEGVTRIPEYFFSNRYNMDGKSFTSVVIPKSCTEIGAGAFARCRKLTSVTIPAGVTYIGGDAFDQTPWLEAQPKPLIVNGLLVDYRNATGNVTVPAGVTQILDGAFEKAQMTGVTLPKGIVRIGGSAFTGCDKLTSITVPEGCVEIGESAFVGCTSLVTAVIGEGCIDLGIFAFGDCHALTTVTLPSTLGQLETMTFPSCPKLKTIYFGGTVGRWKALAPADSWVVTADVPGTIGVEDKTESLTVYCTGKPLVFSDVPAWCKEAVDWAVDNAITKGTGNGKFSPNETCSVAHIITFLYRAKKSPVAQGVSPFKDVSASDWYWSPSIWAAKQDLVSGEYLYPKNACTRAMVVTYLWKLAGSPKTAYNGSFSDVAANAPYAQAVAWAVSKGITNGTGGGKFSPEMACNRGQIVTFLYRCYGK